MSGLKGLDDDRRLLGDGESMTLVGEGVWARTGRRPSEVMFSDDDTKMLLSSRSAWSET